MIRSGQRLRELEGRSVLERRPGDPRPLADAGVPVILASTFEADVVLVPAARLGEAASTLRAAGHHVEHGAQLT